MIDQSKSRPIKRIHVIGRFYKRKQPESFNPSMASHPAAKGKRKLEPVPEAKEDKKTLAASDALVDKPGGYSVVLMVLNSDSDLSRICHQTGLTAQQVECIGKLNGQVRKSLIYMNDLRVVQCSLLCDWMRLSVLERMTDERRQLINDQMREFEYLRGLFTKETRLREWKMQGKNAIDFLYICHS